MNVRDGLAFRPMVFMPMTVVFPVPVASLSARRVRSGLVSLLTDDVLSKLAAEFMNGLGFGCNFNCVYQDENDIPFSEW